MPESDPLSQETQGGDNAKNTEKQKPSGMAIAGFVLSIISLAISGATTFYTTFRSAEIRASVGHLVGLSYQWNDNLQFRITLAYSNTGARPEIVRGLRLACSDHF